MTILKWSSGRKTVRPHEVDPGQISYQQVVSRFFALLGTCKQLTTAGAIGDAIDHSGDGKGCLVGYGVQTFVPKSLGYTHPTWDAQSGNKRVLSTFRLFHLARGETGMTVTIGGGSISYLTRLQVRRLSDFAIVSDGTLNVSEGGSTDDWLSYVFEDLKTAVSPGETFLFCTSHIANTDFYRSVSIGHHRQANTPPAGDLNRNRGPQTTVPFNNGASGAKTAKIVGMHSQAIATETPLTSWHVANAAGAVAAIDERISGAPAIGNLTHTLFASGGTVEGVKDPDADPFQTGAQKTEANEPLCDLQNSSIGWGAVTEENAQYLSASGQADPPNVDSKITVTALDGKPVFYPDLATNAGKTEFVFLIGSSFEALFDNELDVTLEVTVYNSVGGTVSTTQTSSFVQCGSTAFGFAKLNVTTVPDERCTVRVRILCTRFDSHPESGVFSLLSVLQHQPQD